MSGLCLGATGLAATAGRSALPHTTSAMLEDRARPGATLPVVRAHRYRMSGSIRPLLFWVTREEVGAGEIVWRRGEGGAMGYELLIGSDPALAPRGLNRWGYLAEEATGSSGALLGVISAADDESFEAATRHLGAGEALSAFKTIRATVSAEKAEAEVALVGAQSTLTFRDVESVLTLMRLHPESVEFRTAARPTGARSGFLAATAELIDASVRATESDGDGPLAGGGVVPYMYGDGLHDLTLRTHRHLPQETYGGNTYHDVVHAKFETRSRATGDRRRFELAYGTRGTLAGIPVWIRYQPRWWLRVELVLDADAASLRVDRTTP